MDKERALKYVELMEQYLEELRGDLDGVDNPMAVLSVMIAFANKVGEMQELV